MLHIATWMPILQRAEIWEEKGNLIVHLNRWQIPLDKSNKTLKRLPNAYQTEVA